jgi:cytochrome P450
VSRHRTPPGPRDTFLLGSLVPYMRDVLGFLTRCAREYGDVVRVRLPGMTAYLLNHPEHIEYVLRSHPQYFIKDFSTRAVIPVLGQGLLTSEGDFWRRQRRLSQPAFALQQVQTYAAVMVDYTEEMLRGWKAGDERDVHHEMTRLTLRIVARTLFDADVSGEGRQVSEALDTIMTYFLNPLNMLPFFGWLPTPQAWRYRRARRQLNEVVFGLIRRRREEGRDAGDLLSRLLAAQDEDGTRMSDQQLRDESVTLMLAGHETTALTLSYCFYLLARHPEADGRLAAELHEVLGGRAPTVADVPRLRYAEWVVKESMRLYPPAWSIGREAITECEIGGYHVPRGTQLWLVQWVVHRDPRWFDEPKSFRPERWDNDLARRLPRCAYFPFGDGPRICIGASFAMMEAVLILAAVIQRFRLTLASDRPLELEPSITLRPKHGIPMRVEGRAVPKSMKGEIESPGTATLLADGER